MCEYVKNENKCSINNQPCPYMYFCSTHQIWKPLKSMPINCNMKKKAEAPKGYTVVRDERKGWLYLDVDNQTIMLKNPFDYVPRFVKLSKTKEGWKIKTK